MCASVALGTPPRAAPCTALVVLSQPSLGPHDPLLRRSLPPLGPEPENSAKACASLPGRSRRTQYGNEPCTREETAPMIEAREAESESDADLLSRYQQLDDVAA